MAPYVLVVQSDPELGRQIGDTLREARYEMSSEAEGAWAKRSLLVRPPDAVVLDTSLADGSGFSVAEALRKDPDTRNVPIFFIASRFRGQGHASEARRRYGPAEYLPAPLSLDTLLATLLSRLPPKGAEASPLVVRDYPSGPSFSDTAQSDTAQKEEKRQVERAAKELASADPELHGSFARQSFARVLKRIYARRVSGALLAQRDPIKKIVFFQDGYPVSVRSNVLGECLGQILLSQKLISKKALDESLRRMKEDKRQQGSLLIEMGALSPYNLQRALIAQMEAKICDLFSWKAGSFGFVEGRQPRGEPVRLEKTPAALILEGIRRYYNEERQNAVLAPFAGQYVAPDLDPLRRLQDLSGDPAERRFIASVDGSRRLEAVLETAPIRIKRARLLLVAMSEAGMIEPARTAVRQKPDLSAEMLSPENLGQDRNPEQMTPDELGAVLETLRAQTHFDVLGVAADSEIVAVERAYDRLARNFHPDKFRFRADDVRLIAQRIFEHLGEAHAVLHDKGSRRRYLARLQQEDREPLSGAVVPGGAAEKVYFMGVEHLRARRYHDAVSAFRQAVQLAPDNAGYLGALGWAIYREAPADAAAAEAGLLELQRAVSLNGKDPWVRVSLGRFFAETKRPDAAIAEFEVALKLSPGFTDIEEEIRRLRSET